METKKITLRSQTVQCPHCGEYYSVTYKYCPFCDVGRQEEEKRLAEKKKKKQAFFGNLFGGTGEEKKKSRPKSAGQPKAEPGTEAEPAERPRRERAPRETPKERAPREPEGKERSPKEHGDKEPLLKKAPARRHGPRKKTSEMTEEEKAIALAEREARAAARKRERDRLAREAALAAAEEVTVQSPPAEEPPAQVEVAPDGAPVVEPGPVFEEATVPETFGFSAPPLVETDPAALVQAPVSAEGPVVAAEPAPAQSQESPAPTPVVTPEEEAARKQWEAIRALDPMDAAPAIPHVPQATATEIQVGEGPMMETVSPAPSVAPAAPVTPPAQPAAPQQTPVQEAPAEEKPVETEEDLDALLSEIRDLLSESPVPKLDPEQLQKPPQPVAEVQLQQEPAAPAEEAAPAPTEPAPVPPEVAAPAAPAQPEPESQAQPEGEEPTIAIPTQEVRQAQEQLPQEPEAEEELADNQPTITVPTREIAQELEKEGEPEELSLNPAVLPPREKVPAEAKHTSREDHRPAKKAKKKKGGPNVFLILLSLVIVVAAALIVVRNVVPAFENGIFSYFQHKDAESVTLDKTELSLTEAGGTATLVPTFAPEGATATLTWTSSDPAVATVDEQGLVTAVAPGAATITAALENGQTAECQVTCAWGDAPAEPAADPNAGGEPAAPAKPALSADDITLDSAGATRQLTVENATGQVTWASSNPDIATVAEDGTVTAVAPGRATVTAKLGEETFSCAVRCVW